MASIVEFTTINSWKENEMFKKKKTEITLSERNFAALQLAIEILKNQFDQHAIPIDAVLVKENSESLKYIVNIRFETPRVLCGKSEIGFCEVKIEFSISEQKPYKLSGLVRFIVVHGFGLYNNGLDFYYDNEGVCRVPPETKKDIAEFYTRIKDYLPSGSGYPISSEE